jgi:hypothetical protein
MDTRRLRSSCQSMTSVEYRDSTKEPKRSLINAQATVWVQMYYGLWTRKTLLYHVVDCNRSSYLLLCYNTDDEVQDMTPFQLVVLTQAR